eukprot:scaffold3158_cov107-Skeletonema_dohrnii-CCMP3373.AAC.4
MAERDCPLALQTISLLSLSPASSPHHDTQIEEPKLVPGRNQVKVLGKMLGCIRNENQLAMELSLGRNLSFRRPLTAEVGIPQHQAIGKIDR